MKQLLNITLILMILFASCNSSENEDNNEANDTFVDIENAVIESYEHQEIKETVVTQEAIDKLWSQSFSGFLDDEYKIYMSLSSDKENKIEGYYFYESSGQNMSLKGKRTETGFILDEFNQKNKNTGTFEGNYQTDVFSGRWIFSGGTKELSFKLEEVDFTRNCKEIIISESHMDVPENSDFEIAYPAYECDNKALEKRLNIYYSESLTGTSFEELEEQMSYREETGNFDGFSEFYYSIKYNDNCILCITSTVVTVGAHYYYDSYTYNIDLRTGLDLKIRDIFKEDKFIDLTKHCNKVLQENIKTAVKEYDPDGDAGIASMLEGTEFSVSQLANFSFSEKGISFEYFFDFPHAYKAAEPEGQITIPFKDLKDYVKPKGPLHFILN